MRFMIALIAIVLLGGCAETRYAQEGKTVRDAEQDVFACEDKVLAENQGLRNLNEREKQDLMDECMKSKGYSTKL